DPNCTDRQFFGSGLRTLRFLPRSDQLEQDDIRSLLMLDCELLLASNIHTPFLRKRALNTHCRPHPTIAAVWRTARLWPRFGPFDCSASFGRRNYDTHPLLTSCLLTGRRSID